MNKKIIVVGSLNMDLVVTTSRHPLIGETILGGKFATFPGGKGANQAVAAARMGANVCMVGRVGNDAFGAELISVASKDGIDVKNVIMDEFEATGVALITVNSQGQNTIVVASGANFSLTPNDLHQAEGVFEDAGVLISQLESPLVTVQESFSIAMQKGLKVVLNPAPAQLLGDALLGMVDYLIPNEREAMQIAGVDNLEEAIKILLKKRVRNLIITMGENGVLVINSDIREHIPAYKVEAIDTVAAGDAFVGAFSAGLVDGMDVMDAVRFGNAAAAISVTRHGAQPSLPKRAEVLEFLDVS